MKARFQRLGLFFLACCLLLVLPLPNTARGEQIVDVVEGEQAYNFALQDLNRHNFRLGDYRGKTVLLLFMASWVRNNSQMIAHVKEIYAHYNSKGLVVFNIDIRESRKKATRFSKEHGIPYPTLLDRDGKVAVKYGVFGVPVAVLINGKGRIICWDCPSLDKLLEEQFDIKK